MFNLFSLRDTYIAINEVTALVTEFSKPCLKFFTQVAWHYAHNPKKLEDQSYIAKLAIDAAKESNCDPLKFIRALVGVFSGFAGAALGTSLAVTLAATFPPLAPLSFPLGLGLNILCGTLAGDGGRMVVDLVAQGV